MSNSKKTLYNEKEVKGLGKSKIVGFKSVADQKERKIILWQIEDENIWNVCETVTRIQDMKIITNHNLNSSASTTTVCKCIIQCQTPPPKNKQLILYLDR